MDNFRNSLEAIRTREHRRPRQSTALAANDRYLPLDLSRRLSPKLASSSFIDDLAHQLSSVIADPALQFHARLLVSAAGPWDTAPGRTAIWATFNLLVAELLNSSSPKPCCVLERAGQESAFAAALALLVSEVIEAAINYGPNDADQVEVRAI